MNYKLLVDTAVLAGEIMLSSGAETYRVEDTITRILTISGLEKKESFVISTGIMVTLDDPSINTISMVGRIVDRNTNLNNIYTANEISRKLCSGLISVEEANKMLKLLKDKRPYSPRAIYVCTIFTTAFFSVLLGGKMIDCIISIINGLGIVVSIMFANKIKIRGFIKNMIASFFIAVNTMVCFRLLGLPMNIDVIIAGSIMPLVPGVAITNAIRDTLQGDFMSGGARVIEAIVSATSTAVGIGAGLSIVSFLQGGNLLW